MAVPSLYKDPKWQCRDVWRRVTKPSQRCHYHNGLPAAARPNVGVCLHDASSVSPAGTGADWGVGAAAGAAAPSAAACASSALGPASAPTESLLRCACTSSSVGHLNAAFSPLFGTAGGARPTPVAAAAAAAAPEAPGTRPPFTPAPLPAIKPAAPMPGIMPGGMPGGTGIPGGPTPMFWKRQWAAAATFCSKTVRRSKSGSSLRCFCCCLSRASRRASWAWISVVFTLFPWSLTHRSRRASMVSL
mmetsp:Transcript_51655/g.154349  ORF Transcript_51655/g.154349 Transcript_51655/m.154349 type:complete len:246 (+) Transcript_51655:56-793(+)